MLSETKTGREIEKTIIDVVAQEGFELVHYELASGAKYKILRIIVDHPDGISHDDCSLLSNRIGLGLDQISSVTRRYILEVSSPGVERGLYKIRDYQRFIGHKVNLRTISPIDGISNFNGTIEDVKLQVNDNDSLIVLSLTGKNMQQVEIPFSFIKKANLKVDLKDLFRVAQEKDKKVEESL